MGVCPSSEGVRFPVPVGLKCVLSSRVVCHLRLPEAPVVFRHLLELPANTNEIQEA